MGLFFGGNTNEKPSNPMPSEDDLNSKLDPIKTAYEVGPHVYQLINHHSDELTFFAEGCGGVPGEKQKKVASRMDGVAAFKPPAFFLGCGDNFYHDGVTDYRDSRFTTQYHDTYGDPLLEHLAPVPGFIGLGNHDGRRHKWEQLLTSYTPTFIRTPPQTGEVVEVNQVAHSYTTQPNDKNINVSKCELYSSETLDITNLPKWNMPFFYYSIICEKVQIFVLNSNSYVSDWLKKEKLSEKKESDLAAEVLDFSIPLEKNCKNQATWFETECKKAKLAGRTVIVVMHHPLFTASVRHFQYKGDAELYLTPDELKEANERLNQPVESRIYNEILRKVFQTQEILMDMVIAAHDHSLYYYNNILDIDSPYKICQVVTGGGGGDLQDRMNFQNHKNLGGFLKQTGFIAITCNKYHPELITIEIFTTENHYLKFTNKDPIPVREPSLDNRIEIIRELILEACDEYQIFLDNRQTINEGKFFRLTTNHKHTTNDLDIMHELMSYLNKPIPSDYDSTLVFLHELISKIYNKKITGGHSLYLLILTKLKSKIVGEAALKKFEEFDETLNINDKKTYY